MESGLFAFKKIQQVIRVKFKTVTMPTLCHDLRSKGLTCNVDTVIM